MEHFAVVCQQIVAYSGYIKSCQSLVAVNEIFSQRLNVIIAYAAERLAVAGTVKVKILPANIKRVNAQPVNRIKFCVRAHERAAAADGIMPEKQ